MDFLSNWASSSQGILADYPNTSDMKYLPIDRVRYPLRGSAQGGVVEVSVPVSGGCAAMSQQSSSHVQAFTIHDCMGRVTMPQIVKLRIGHDARFIAHPTPEQVKSRLAQGPAGSCARKHPLTRACLRQMFQQILCRFAEQDVPRPRLCRQQAQDGRVSHRAIAAAALHRSGSQSAGSAAPPQPRPAGHTHGAAAPPRAATDRPHPATGRVMDGDNV